MLNFIDGIVALIGGIILVRHASQVDSQQENVEIQEAPKPSNKHTGLMKLLGIFIIIIGIGRIVYGLSTLETPESRRAEFAKRLTEETKKILPKQVDETTELVGLAVQEDVIVYRYEVTGLSLDEVDVDQFQTILKDSLLHQITSHPQKEQFLKFGFSMKHIYTFMPGDSEITVEIAHSEIPQ